MADLSERTVPAWMLRTPNGWWYCGDHVLAPLLNGEPGPALSLPTIDHRQDFAYRFVSRHEARHVQRRHRHCRFRRVLTSHRVAIGEA